MRQSTTRRIQFGADTEHAVDVRLRPARVCFETDPHGPLAATRRGYLEQVVDQLKANGRAPRVCLYALSVRGQRPNASLEAAATFAGHQNWQVGSGLIFTDHHGIEGPSSRPGWRAVREQVRAGYADGVVAVTATVVSTHVEEYQQEIDWFGHHWGFIGLVIPEIRKDQR